MDTPEVLEVVAHSVTAVLSAWLGFTVVTRSASPPARIFGFVALAIAVWSTTVIVDRLSSVEEAKTFSRGVGELLAAFVIAGTAHLSLAIATEGHPSSRRRWIVASLYALNIVFAMPTILDPTLSPPHLTAAGEPEAVVFGWAWVALRLSTLSLGAA
ncbi:hypothetical protein BH20CHL6_BH20CHL6_08950 [soil metagenome]